MDFFQGIYVLQDNSFKPISRLSSWEGRADALKRAKLVSRNGFVSDLDIKPFPDTVCRYAGGYHSRCPLEARIFWYCRTRNHLVAPMHAFSLSRLVDY